MVILISLLESAEDGYRRELIRFVYHNLLETAFECLVLLEIFLIFVECGRSDRAEFAACEGRFQDVGGIHGALTLSGTDKSMYLIDEKNDFAVALGNFVDDGLETFLKFTFILCASDERPHVERINLFRLQVLRYVTAHNSHGETLGDGCLAGTGFADKHRIVFGAA